MRTRRCHRHPSPAKRHFPASSPFTPIKPYPNKTLAVRFNAWSDLSVRLPHGLDFMKQLRFGEVSYVHEVDILLFYSPGPSDLILSLSSGLFVDLVGQKVTLLKYSA